MDMRLKIIISIFSIFIGMQFGVVSNAKQVHDHVKSSAESHQHPKKILVLHQFKSRQGWTKLFNRYLLEALIREKVPSWELRSEYLDLLEFNDEAYKDMLEKQLLYKYTLSPPDIVVLELDAALQFVLERNLFPDTPKIAAITSRSFKLDNDTLFIVKLRFNLEESLKHAFELLPGTQNVYVVCESISPVGTAMVTGFRKMSERIYKQKTFHYYTGMNVEEILNRSANLPEDSFIFMLPYSRDPDGHPVTTADFARKIGENANRPVFTFLDLFALNTGILGGKVSTTKALAEQTSHYIKEALLGNTQEIATPKTQFFEYIYDWGAIQKWNIDIDKLPANSLIQNRTYTMFELFKWEIIGGIVLLVGESIIVIFLIENIRRRRRAEESLRRSEKQLRLIANSLPVFISYVDSEMCYRFTNSAYLEFINLRSDQIIGKSVSEVLGKDLYPIVRPHVIKVLEGEQVSFEAEVTRNGIHYIVDIIYIPDKDDTGMTKGYFVLGTDVTKRKQREMELQIHRDELAHVSRLTTMGELTASMAHELNQPLTAILSNAQAARRFLEHDPVDIEEVKEILDDIIGDDRRADQVIKRLRGFLKRGEFHLKTWDINEVIQEVVTLVHSDAVIRNVSVHLDLVEELPPVLGDRIQIQQVLLNLIINGLDAMSDVHQKPRDLMIKSEYESNKEVKVSVADSGTGILPGQMQLIFEPFHTTKADGMGMGLSINRSIIRAHQGKLWVENNVNQGATFIFTLPVASEDNTDGQ
jgi:PAS domain S-box-containing protein